VALAGVPKVSRAELAKAEGFTLDTFGKACYSHEAGRRNGDMQENFL